MTTAGEFTESTSTREGSNGKLLIQTRHDLPPQLTLGVYDSTRLAAFQSSIRDHVVVDYTTTRDDVLLAAIAMIQNSGMMLNVNAFMASLFCTLTNRQLILDALRELFRWVGITYPSSELTDIYVACRR